MGITGFAKFIEENFPNAIQNTTIRNLQISGRIAVDGFNECYVQMHVSKTSVVKRMVADEVFDFFRNTSFRDELTTRVRKIWLTRIVDFIVTDLKRNVVWVFDGDNVPKLKDETRAERRERTEKIKEEMNRFVEKYEKDDFPNQAEYRKVLEEYLTSRPPTFEDYQILTTILISIGIPVVKAWGEGEKTCARLCIPELTNDPELICSAVWSADVDSILFGAPVLIQRKRSFGPGGKENTESGQLRLFLTKEITIPLPNLIKVCVASGCDYLPKGIPGMGLKKAFKNYGPETSTTEFPQEHQAILNIFSHDPEIEKDTKLTNATFTEKILTDPLVKWFTTMYG